MTQLLRVGVVAEDANFASFLVPAIMGLARRAGVPVAVFRPQTTSGCQAEALRRAWARLSEGSDLIVVGADSGGAWHRRRAATFRQKAKHLKQVGPTYFPHISRTLSPIYGTSAVRLVDADSKQGP